MQSTADQLKANTSLFVDFTAADLEVLAPAVVRRTLSPGEVLCRCGEPGTSLFVISVGSIEVRRPIEDTDVALATLNRGEACGEMALVMGGDRTADLIALEETAVLEISRESLDEVMFSYPDIAAKLWHNLALALSQRLEATNALLADSVKINRKLLQDDAFRKVYSKV